MTDDRERLIQVGDSHQIQCDCGRWLNFDKRTECEDCAAQYTVHIEQTVQPVEDVDTYRDDR
jgi:hypothetical protein